MMQCQDCRELATMTLYPIDSDPTPLAGEAFCDFHGERALDTRTWTAREED